MEKLLITGATGFIGGTLLEKLRGRYELHIIAERKVAAGRGVKAYVANITNFKRVAQLVKRIDPDYAIHMAAKIPISFSFEHPLEVNRINYLGTVNIANACRELKGFRQFIFSGTSEEYGSIATSAKPIREDSAMMPNNPYAVSKVASEHYLMQMNRVYGFPCTVLRGFSTYGRKTTNNFFIEKTITQMMMGNHVKLGNPDVVRDWLYVGDHADGYVKAIGNRRSIGKSINLCTGKGYTTRDTARIIAKITGFDGMISWNSVEKRPFDAKFLVGDNTLARRILGWKPKYTLEKGVREIADYWSERLD
ncbi:MAG: GDP-mannose 4,6-dehydratase [Candidatus Micrarchaeota archaeon]|nr:GDP-mannose 4,6-dehydratase [Candidatus Micrarchaeota archaeon]